MELGPVPDECQRSGFQGSRKDGSVDRDRRPPSGVVVDLADEAIRLADLPAARQRTIAVLGHEQTGIPPDALDPLDLAVEISMIGTGASLNMAVAGSLVLYRLAGLI
jgi:tRNA (guanosine-2'-O-)-methyltransferase